MLGAAEWGAGRAVLGVMRGRAGSLARAATQRFNAAMKRRDSMAEDGKQIKKSRMFVGSRQGIDGGWGIEKPATSRPKRKD